MLQDTLSELLASLDKQEKRYLQIEMARRFPNDGQLFRLWMLVQENPSMSSAELRMQLKGTSLYGNYPVIRHQLCDRLLHVLAVFHEDRLPEKKISEGLQQVAVLFEKKLYVPAQRLVRSLKKKTALLELHYRHAELLNWELRLLHIQGKPRDLQEQLEKNYRAIRESLDAASQEQLLQKLSYENFISLKTDWIRHGAQITDPMKAIMAMKPAEIKSLRATLLWRQTISAHLFSVGDKEGAFRQLDALSRLMDKHPALREQYLNQYIGLLNNMNLLLFERGDFENILNNIEKLRAIRTSSSEKKQRIRERLLNVEMNVYRTLGDWKRAASIASELEAAIADEKTSLVYRRLFYFDLSLLHLATGNFKAALRMSRRLLQFTDTTVRPDINVAAKLIELVSLAELQRLDDLLQAANTLAKDAPDPYIKAIATFFTELPVQHSEKKRLEKTATFQQILFRKKEWKILRETHDRNFPFIAWLRFCTEHKPLEQTLTEAFQPPKEKMRKKKR